MDTICNRQTGFLSQAAIRLTAKLDGKDPDLKPDVNESCLDKICDIVDCEDE
jgi:hypothetical protein